MNAKHLDFLRRIVLADSMDLSGMKGEALDLLLEEDRNLAYDAGSQSNTCKARAMRDLRLSSVDYTEIQTLILENRKIPAIKRLREITNGGLKECKETVENPNYFEQPLPTET